MKVLVIAAGCIQVNTSANLCHLAYLRGLADLGAEITLLSADGDGYVLDESMEIPEGVRHCTYTGLSLYEKLSNRYQSAKNPGTNSHLSAAAQTGTGGGNPVKAAARKTMWRFKGLIRSLYGPHGIYTKFISEAKQFRSDERFDYLLSLSTPASSHRLACELLRSGRVKAGKWIQIWEDPWYNEVAGFTRKKRFYREEQRLLAAAQRVCYVSPVTLQSQKKLFPESADKMYWKPLPFYYRQDEDEVVLSGHCYGYFGEYMPQARNLEPFYRAAREAQVHVNICGNPSDLFEPTDRIRIYPRMPLTELRKIEEKTNVLVFLCNLRGGQIPGKIYQYSATHKTILFILDGTEEEQKILKEYFSGFHRYVFCRNTREDIAGAIRDIEEGNLEGISSEPLRDFTPEKIVRSVLEG